jgi:hypothetical protein
MNNQRSFSNIASGNLQGRKEFTGDDFPALGTTTQTREEILMSNLLGNSKSSNIGSSIMTRGNMDFSTLKPLSGGGFPKNQQPGQTDAKRDTSATDNADRFGLLGLKKVIQMTDPDLSLLSLGCDLTTLGLDLNSNENVYSNFITPFSDTPYAGSEPSFPSMSSYQISNLPNALSKLSCFNDETLFYIFYSMPRDILQEAAAQELYKRRWRLHKEYKLWLTKETFESEPLAKGVDFERDIYIFFDPSTWTRVQKEWLLYFDQIEERGSSGETKSIFDLPVDDIQTGVEKLGIKAPRSREISEKLK